MVTVARTLKLLGAIGLIAAAAACGGSPSAAPAATSDPVAAPPATTVAAPATPGATPTTQRVSANTASEGQIAQALQAAGVRNPKRWAEEVVEYRPYPPGDANLTKLRQKLAKYNPGQDTTDKIVSALTP